MEDKDAVDYQVKVSDLDVNRHLTSSKYIDHLLDRFSLEIFDKERVARFEIQYISEARYGDDVYLMKQKIRENEFNLEMRSFNGESLCKCKCIFL